MARAVLAPREDREIFVVPLTVLPEHIDDNGHVNNVVYVGWLQDIAVAHWRSLIEAADEAAWAWIVLRHEIDYRRALSLGETAQARTWVADAPEGPRFDRFVRIDGPNGAMCAQARTTWCLIDQSTRRPKRVPQRLAELFS